MIQEGYPLLLGKSGGGSLDFLLKKVIIINSKDNVAIAIRKLKKKQKYDLKGNIIIIKDDIEPGFKLAIKNIKKGDMVIKYGETIGRAIQDIEIGEFVHTHNLEGIRGRRTKYIEKKLMK